MNWTNFNNKILWKAATWKTQERGISFHPFKSHYHDLSDLIVTLL